MKRSARGSRWLQRTAVMAIAIICAGIFMWGPDTALAKVKAKGPGGIDVYAYPGL